VFLYLLDDETSWSVSIPLGIGLLIEFWKLRKVVWLERIVTVGAPKTAAPAAAVDPTVSQSTDDKKDNPDVVPVVRAACSALESRLGWRVVWNQDEKDETKAFDAQAVRTLMYIMTPCLLLYSAYSAVYDMHKGWYSFIIRIQARFIYFAGFAMMTPQIWINYKLKSVAHLPWRTFTYKALNTFIDDLFAFIIKMPTMHRLACFRDDVVFFILLYQRWIYRVDKLRANEYGQTGEDAEARARAALQANQPATAVAEVSSGEEKKTQ
jgi:hypothetical protein